MPGSYSALELFAGGGGMALGFHNAGIKHIALIDHDIYCCQTLRHNMDTPVIHADINDYDFNSFKNNDIDIISGGFPCQPFSTAGKGLGLKDSRSNAFYGYLNAIKTINPKLLVCENVPGLIYHNKGQTLDIIRDQLGAAGYVSYVNILNAQHYDVPQARKRLVIVGVRQDIDVEYRIPEKQSHTITLREALCNTPIPEHELTNGTRYSFNKTKVLDLVPPGGNWRSLPVEIQKSYMKGSYNSTGGRTGMARRLSWDKPSPTLTCSPAQNQTECCHPDKTRPLTIREYARIQTFPDDYLFYGSLACQYTQIGNAVPVNLAYHIAKSLIAVLDAI